MNNNVISLIKPPGTIVWGHFGCIYALRITPPRHPIQPLIQPGENRVSVFNRTAILKPFSLYQSKALQKPVRNVIINPRTYTRT